MEEANDFMQLISRQQDQLASLIRQTRVLNENKLAFENQQLTERLKLLEQISEKRKMQIAMVNQPPSLKKKHKKKHRKHKKKDYPPLPLPYAGMYGMPPPGYYNGLGQVVGHMNYPVFHNGMGGGMYPGYGTPDRNQNYSALAGAGLKAMNMRSNYDQYDYQHNSHQDLPNADFENKNKIVDGRDINDNNKEQLKLLLQQELSSHTKPGNRLRPPSQS